MFTVLLTHEGKQLVKKVIPEAVKYRKKGIRGISAEEMKTFEKVLSTIYKNFTADS
ncbi:MAG: hypothetical protein AAF789_07010 [Bacteroidota bacterium]